MQSKECVDIIFGSFITTTTPRINPMRNRTGPNVIRNGKKGDVALAKKDSCRFIFSWFLCTLVSTANLTCDRSFAWLSECPGWIDSIGSTTRRRHGRTTEKHHSAATNKERWSIECGRCVAGGRDVTRPQRRGRCGGRARDLGAPGSAARTRSGAGQPGLHWLRVGGRGRRPPAAAQADPQAVAARPARSHAPAAPARGQRRAAPPRQRRRARQQRGRAAAGPADEPDGPGNRAPHWAAPHLCWTWVSTIYFDQITLFHCQWLIWMMMFNSLDSPHELEYLRPSVTSQLQINREWTPVLL